MLEVQHYLKTEGKSFETLTEELGIKVTIKDHLAKLSYSQIDSPKTHPIVMECRGLVLNTNSFDVVGACFTRFFNLGEAENITAGFNWSRLRGMEKVDGSWISVFNDPTTEEWRCTTRGSFADMEIAPGCPRWDELVFSLMDEAMPTWREDLPLEYTYIFELCSMYNKVVREYKTPTLFLLGVIQNATSFEVAAPIVDMTARDMGFKRPIQYEFEDVEHIKRFLAIQEREDATFEGVVISDGIIRLKVKSATYVALHHLKGEGKNMFMPKYILPFVLSGEKDELLTYFPEVKPNFDELNGVVMGHLERLLAIWEETKHIEDQKSFAKAIVGRTPFSSVLFSVRKEGTDAVESKFRSLPDLILKVVLP